MSKVVGIIPACGIGSRMGMQLNQSKEMIPDPNNKNKPLIAWTLELCARSGVAPVIITRKEKQDLILYAKNKAELIILDEIPAEWPNTVLASKETWGDKNLLLLPDTRFEPVEALESAIRALDQEDFVFGAHKVEDVSKWGSIEYNKQRKDLLVCEKPSAPGAGLAWGFIGFKNNSKSENLFNIYTERNKFLYLKNFDIVYLSSFKDITRTGVIE